MNPDGQLKKAAMVKFERILPGPVERVWEFLTDHGRHICNATPHATASIFPTWRADGYNSRP
jgi:hypothetical protein